ncbi:hypothetical protein M514_07696 [Trichuris suis]|uniref:Cystatin domain-containing protein n=1 Tax=Trichuris suis TaxID=68888 RepID=A0A085MXJ8_9BILA|nr:hypothetical protein M513_07696 [Trichuris suis]KFD61944.1 hypothetical protein M514_07696 [Trichuris suis]
MEPYLTRHVSVVVSIVLLLLSSRSMAFPCVQCNSDEHFHETQISAKIKKMVEDSISNMNKEEPDHYYVLQKIASARKKKMGNTKDYLVTYFIVKCSKKSKASFFDDWKFWHTKQAQFKPMSTKSWKTKRIVEDAVRRLNKYGEEAGHYVLDHITSAYRKTEGRLKTYAISYVIAQSTCTKAEALKKKDKACKVEDNAKRLRCKRVFTYAYGRLLHEMYGKKCEQ